MVPGGATAGELAGWFEKAGYTDVINHSGNPLGNYPGLWANEASQLFEKGYKVCLLINSNVLNPAAQDEDSWKLDHFVGLVSPIKYINKYYPEYDGCNYEGRARMCGKLGGGYDAQDSTVSLRVYTWGGERDVPEWGTLSVKSFMGNFYGFVAGKY
jgi:hypothetical protein